MSQVAVVTDSAACLPLELVQAYDIRMVPFGLTWGDEVLQDGADITPSEFCDRLRDADE